jgi:hypothetical protein
MSPWRITFLLHALPAMQEEVFFSVANPLNLEVDLLFFDSSSTYWERDSADDGLGGDSEVGVEPAAEDGSDQTTDTDGDKEGSPVEGATRRYGRSKDHRGDLRRVVIELAVTREGIPVRLWTFPGDTSEQLLLRTVKDDLRAWNSTESSGCSTGDSPRRRTGATCNAVADTTSWARSCAAQAPRRPRRVPPRPLKGSRPRSPTLIGSRRRVSARSWLGR